MAALAPLAGPRSVDRPQAPAIDASTSRMLGLELLVGGGEFNLKGSVMAT
jgi:hypothetical protein